MVSKSDYYRKVAVHELEQHLGIDMDADEMDQLACSLAKQWQQYEGHASLFIEGDEQVVFTLTLTHTDGGCNVNAEDETWLWNPCSRPSASRPLPSLM